MKKSNFIALALMGAFAVPLALSAGSLAAELKAEKTMKPATLAYPIVPSRSDAGKMIGHEVESITGEKVGSIEGIHIGRDGKVSDVVVGVGGFLGVGQRDVLVKWSSLRVVNDPQADQIDKIVISATKDQLKNMTAYTFSRPDLRRTVFDAPM